MQTTYLSCAETAKLVRTALKRTFPGTKFSVRSETYSMGASINVSWTDGPTTRAVEGITGQFSGAQFDGMIDLKVSHTSWLLPDGTATVASAPGTVGSMGVISAEREWMPHPDAKLVHFGADFIFTRREISPAYEAACSRAWAGLNEAERVRLTNAEHYPQWQTVTPGHCMAHFFDASLILQAAA